MSQLGQRMLKRLWIRYCDHGGSSTGIREFMKDYLPDYAKKHPELDIVVFLGRGKHPNLRGEYVHGKEHTHCVKNLSPPAILEKCEFLRSQSGHKARKWGAAKRTKRPSIQGPWNPYLFMKVNPKRPSTQTK
eukprot:gb/GECH01006221.1/.p1 GENE.gb/GECH01006221.1/~~gb/GECH01006221.1/.p1  ORF type:complete len:132 (+),score=21.36 gb/GECH01006221.1/:1-396(+)